MERDTESALYDKARLDALETAGKREGVSVGGTVVTGALDFSSDTPAAPADGINVTFQANYFPLPASLSAYVKYNTDELAVDDDGALELAPGIGPLPKEIRTINLSAQDITDFFTGGLGNDDGPYAGWAICDGNNGTPNLSGKFPRITTGAAGTTGGEDTNSHTHDLGNHTHLTSIGADGVTEYWADDGAGNMLYGSSVLTNKTRYTQAQGASSVGNVRVGKTDVPSSNASGTPSDTENRPAFYELTALMWLGS